MPLYFTRSLVLILALIFSACQTDYATLPTYNGARQLQAVIEVPAGNNTAIAYNQATKSFEAAQQAGGEKKIPFLPYPGNFGFIPSTEVGPDGQGIKTILLSERLETGTVTEVVPVATLLLQTHDGDLYPIIVTVPARPTERLIEATNFVAFRQQYPAVMEILKLWFEHHDPAQPLQFVSWKDEKFAEQEIQRWMKL